MKYQRDGQARWVGASRGAWVLLALGLVLAWTLLVPADAAAEEPCCAITAIDAKTGIVTAKETATGRTFKFKLSNAKQLGALKVGQAVEADFKNAKVTVRPAGAEPLNGIITVRPAEPLGRP